MQELIYVRDKIKSRIKSMSSDKEGIYAKRMMRRCVKDIDSVIHAIKNAQLTDEESASDDHIYNLADFPLMRDIFEKPENKQDIVNDVFDILKSRSVTRISADYVNESGSITSITVEAK